MFEKAVALDPGYAEAYAALGFVHWVEYAWQWDNDPHALFAYFLQLPIKPAALFRCQDARREEMSFWWAYNNSSVRSVRPSFR